MKITITKELLDLFRFLIYRDVSLSQLFDDLRFTYCLTYREIGDIVKLSPQRICDIAKHRSNVKEDTYLRILYYLDEALNLDYKEVKNLYDKSNY